MNPSLEIIRKRMKSTSYARFFAARRYDSLNNQSLFSLSIASFSLIFVTLLQKYSSMPIFDSTKLELIQLIASIIIATLSIVVSFASFSIKSEKMRVSGEEINELVAKVDCINDLPWDSKTKKKATKIRKRYEILKAKSLNHKNFEFEYGKIERKREENKSEASYNCKVTFKSFIANLLPYIPFNIISLISVFLVLYSISLYFDSNTPSVIGVICSC